MLNYVPQEIQVSIIKLFPGIQLEGFRFSSGGCINQAGVVEFSSGSLFIKWNKGKLFPGMFETEAKGLQTLREANCVRIPDVIHQENTESFSFLLLERIDSSIRNPTYFQNLGTSLAELHKIKHDSFGLEYDNYIGSLPQINKQRSEWIDFFKINRIEFQYRMAVDNGKMRKGFDLDHLFKRIEEILPKETPSLIHGDLWSGNQMADERGEPVLIDPAIYYANREVEIAFTKLFGGFDQSFYEAYNENYPLEQGFHDRQDIYNLYPLLVHANLFGGGYINQVNRILHQFTN